MVAGGRCRTKWMFGVHGKYFRILRARDHEPALGAARRAGSINSRSTACLAVGGVGAEIGEIAGERRMGAAGR